MLFSLFGLFSARRRLPTKTCRTLLDLEALEGRCLPSVVPVLNTDLQNISQTTVSQASLAPGGTVLPGSAINITYFNTSGISGASVTNWHGLTAGDATGELLIAGTSNGLPALYDGTIDGNGTSMLIGFGGLVRTYGVENLGGGHVLLFGEVALFPRIGFMIDGNIVNGSFIANQYWLMGSGLNSYGAMGGIAVGAWGFSSNSAGSSAGFLYDLPTHRLLTTVTFPNAVSTTLTGIWYNGGTSYTLAGGYSSDFVNNSEDPTHPIGHAFLVDYDSATGTFSHWTPINDPLDPQQLTTFVGISSPSPGVYTLAADFAATTSDPAHGAWVTIGRNADGSFGAVDWVTLGAPGLDPSTNVTTVTGVYGNQIVGMVNGQDPFQATTNITVPTPSPVLPPEPTPVTPPTVTESPPGTVNAMTTPVWVAFLTNNLLVHDLSTSQAAGVSPSRGSASQMFGAQASPLDPTVAVLPKASSQAFFEQLLGDGAVPEDLEGSGDGELPAHLDPGPKWQTEDVIVLAPNETMTAEAWPGFVSLQAEAICGPVPFSDANVPVLVAPVGILESSSVEPADRGRSDGAARPVEFVDRGSARNTVPSTPDRALQQHNADPG